MPDVKIAVLFGSALTRNLVRDLDVGIYMDGEPDLKRIVEIAGILEDSGYPHRCCTAQQDPAKAEAQSPF